MELTGRVERHDSKSIVYCNELPLTGIGDSPEEALNSFTNCLKEYLNAINEHGILEKVLRDYGVISAPSISMGTGNFSIKMPYKLTGITGESEHPALTLT